MNRIRILGGVALLLILTTAYVIITDRDTTTEPTPPRDPDIVVSVYSTGVDGDPGTRVPDFEMRADGTVFLNGDDGRFGIDRYELTDAGIQQVRDLARGISTSADRYGDVGWTDQGTTSIYVNLDGEPSGVDIYALRTITDPMDLVTDIGARRMSARRNLRKTLDALDDLGERARNDGDELIARVRAPYAPARLELTLLPAVSDTGDPLTPDPSTLERHLDIDTEGMDLDDQGRVERVAWPLDRPLAALPLRWRHSRLCTILDGADADAVADLVNQPGLQSRLFSTGTASSARSPDLVRLTVHGLLPGDDGECTGHDAPPELDVGPLHPVILSDPAAWGGKLDADRFTPPTPLEVYAAAPILAAGVIAHNEDLADSDEAAPTDSDLTWYEYRAIAAEVDGTRYLDIEAEEWLADDGDRPDWRARIDLAQRRITTLEVDP